MERKSAVYYTYEEARYIGFTKRYTVDISGNIYGRNGKILKQTNIGTQLTDDNDEKTYVLFSRLILSTFRGNPGPMMQADHIDEAKWNDNSLKNLQWLTPSENTKKQRSDVRAPISGIPIIRIDADGNKEHYVSGNSAEMLTGVSRGHIAKSCKTGYKAGGYSWIYDISKLNQEDLENEIWKPVVKRDGTDYEKDTNIEVSDKNRIRLAKPVMRIFTVEDFLTERDIERKNRPCITVQNERRYIAELICTVFNGPKSEHHEIVRHLDDVYTNCIPSNLKWGTYKENFQDALINNKTVSIPLVYDGKQFSSATEAAEHIGISFSLLCKMIREENRTTFFVSDFAKKVYVVNDKKFKSYVQASLDYCGKHTRSMKLVEEGVIRVDYVTINEYKAL